MNKKILFAAILAATLGVGASAADFAKTGTYTPGQFSDIPQTEWYASEVANAYELGLMNGIGDGLFAPDGNVTVAEAVTMASRAAAIYAGETIDTATAGEWFTPYVNYALSKGIIKDGQFEEYDRAAKRSEVAVIFKNAMPGGLFHREKRCDRHSGRTDKSAYAADLYAVQSRRCHGQRLLRQLLPGKQHYPCGSGCYRQSRRSPGKQTRQIP